MPNPYAPRVKRADAPGFPGGRFARLGANALQIAVGEWMWGLLGDEERELAAAYLAGMADEELGQELADDDLADPGDLTLEELLVVHEWATAEVDAGRYVDRDEALEALDDAVADLQLDEEGAKREAAEALEAEQLAELEAFLATQEDRDAAVAALQELAGAEHEGEPQPRDADGNLIPTPDALTGVVTPEGGPVDPANIPVGEHGLEEFVPGGPGTADGGAVAAPPAAPSPSAADQVLDEEAAMRIGGSVDSLMEWVGDDLAKAGAVRRAEQAKPEEDQRKTLHERLDKLVGTPDAG